MNIFVVSIQGENLVVTNNNNTYNISSNEELFFKSVIADKIKSFNYNKDLDRMKIITTSNIFYLENYNLIRKNPSFKVLDKELFFRNILKKFKKPILVGSATAGIVTTMLINNLPNNDVSYINLNSNNSINFTDINNKPKDKIASQIEQIEILEIDLPETNQEIPFKVNFDEKEYIDYNDLEFINDYDEIIKFASKLYFVDYETSKNIVKENYNNIISTNIVVDNKCTLELDRMKDLINKNVINGDIYKIGIFISIKDYALKNSLYEADAIKSTKTSAEKEKDLIMIAKYIYGIENEDLLKLILAIYKTETGHGTSKAALDLNNVGGNMSASATSEKLILNTYKTTEIGEESMIRNFLLCYDKCFYNPLCNPNDKPAYFISNMYCTHTPEEWENTITEIAESELVQKELNSYLNKNYTK